MSRTASRLSLLAGVCSLAGILSLQGAPVSAQQAPTPQLLVTPAQLAAFQMAADRDLNYLPGEVIVKFRTGVSVNQQTRALSALRSRPLPDRMQWIADRTARLSVPEDPDSIAMAASLARQPEVEYAQPNWIRRPSAVPNDPQFAPRQWNMTLLDMPRAWDISSGGTGVTVAVIDTGMTSVNATYALKTWNGSAIVTTPMRFGISPDIDPSRIAAGRDFVFWNGPVLDVDGHGTHVSATVAQTTNNNFGYAGMAFNAKLMPLKVCLSFWDIQIAQAEAGIPGYPSPDAGGCPTSAIVAAIHYAADNGAKVINMSLGGTSASPADLDGLNYATSRGVFVAIAAGNEFDEGNPTVFPASYTPQVRGAMSVGAVGRASQRAYYSTTGSYVEIAAPGGDFRAGGLDGVIYQVGILFGDYNPSVVILPRFDRYSDTPQQGTSMASPHVAGLAALLISQGVTLPAAVEALIAGTARDLGAAGRDNDFGAGLIQPRAALRGFGVVK
ncbi:MAG: S8 family serine peptidase [Vicinamibacterales bacterium]